MSELELLLREVKDKWTRENFARILRYIEDQVILDGEWTLYEVRFEAAANNFKFKHNLKFVPQDIIHLQVVGDRNVEFNHELFDRTNIDITVKGPCYIRFLAGRYPDEILGASARQGLINVSVGAGDSGGGTPATNQICQLMDCASGLAVNDWVYQDPSTSNRAVKTSSNSQIEPTIGIVKNKPTATTCEVLLNGLYSGLVLGDRGEFWLGDTGNASFTFPSSGTGKFVRSLGVSFGNGTIFVDPNHNGWELDDG